MKREIKFRCTYTDGKNWIKKDFTLKELMNGDCFDVISDQPLLKNYKMDETYQFTGIHDKNGKEIYEGDVCSFVYDHIGNVWIMSVEWNNTEARFVLRDNINFVSLDEDDFEVIGNIYENPELL